jgi:lactate dehydrogenase-like 2-hydroxyacid dehydrogenase
MNKIFVTRSIPESGLQRLRSLFEVDVWLDRDPPPREVLLQRASGCSGVLSMLSDRIDDEFFQAVGGNLRGVANFAVGYNNIDVQAARSRGIQVGNTPGVLTNATADTAVGLILAAGRCFRPAMHNVEQLEWRNWEPMMFLGHEFEGKTLGIVGMGRIGHAVAKRMHGGWGMQVVYTSRTPKSVSDRELNARHVGLEELLSSSDVISLNCPLTDQTRNLIGAKELASMKSTAILVNTARGEVIDQMALAKALAGGQLFAAGLDVTTPEPIAADHPLRNLSNCLILPHIGSATYHARSQMATMAAENLLSAIEGKPMPFAVG